MSKVLSTADNILFLNFSLIVIGIFCLYFIYIFIKKKAYQDLQVFLYHIKISIYIAVLVCAILLLKYKIIIFEITEDEDEASIIWVLIIALLMGMYITITFGSVGLSKNWQKYFAIIVIAYISFSGFGYIGYRIIFDFPDEVLDLLKNYAIWRENVFESNTGQGLDFLGGNLPIFLIVYFLSYALEGEKRAK